MMLWCSMGDWKRKEEKVVMGSGLRGGLSLGMWI